jgi:hypothetical protein
MSTYTLTEARRTAYAELFDFRTQVVRAARQILSAGGIEAVGPGEGVAKVPRYFITVDFARGGALGRKQPIPLSAGRAYEYSSFAGTLTVMVTVPMEVDEKEGTAYLSETHARTLDEVTATVHTLFMEHLEPFTSTLLPKLDVQELVPIDPDERPEAEREINTVRLRWRLRFDIRPSAWPTA